MNLFRKSLVLLLSLTMTCLTTLPSSAAETPENAIEKAINYLQEAQNADGGFPGTPGRNSDVDTTGWAIMALAAAGEDVTSGVWEKEGKSPIDFLTDKDFIPNATTDYAKLLLVLTAAGLGSEWQGEDLVESIQGFQQTDGSFYQPDKSEKGMINAHMWSILALASAGAEVPSERAALTWLKAVQNEDGGYSWYREVESDSDDTAIAIQALLILGEDPDSAVISDAKTFMKSCQKENGGFYAGELSGMDANVASDAWVMQAILALGDQVDGSIWTHSGKNVMGHILSLQQADGGFEWKEGVTASPVKMTAYALMALRGSYYGANTLGMTSFADMDSNHWAYDAVTDLVNRGVINGYDDGTFRPDNQVTRAEFTTMLIKAFGQTEAVYSPKGDFGDVASSHWAYPYISRAYAFGYINGRSASVFDPNGSISGAELATIAVNTLPSAEVTQGLYWYSGNVALAEEEGLLYQDFNALESATRAECAFVVMQLID